MEQKLYTISEVAKELDVSRTTAYAWHENGRFPNAFTVGEGDMVLVPASDVEAARREEADKLIEKLGRLGFQTVTA